MPDSFIHTVYIIEHICTFRSEHCIFEVGLSDLFVRNINTIDNKLCDVFLNILYLKVIIMYNELDKG